MDARNYSVYDELLDGRRVLVRAIRPDDKKVLLEGFGRLTDESVHRRFFSMKKGLTERDLAYFTELDFIRHVALLAFVDESESQLGVGVGRFIVEDHHPTPGTAEIAFTVDDAHQGLGVGTALLKHLVAIARDLGLRQFRAEVLAENRAMLHVFSHSGLPMRQTRSSGVAEVYLSLGSDRVSGSCSDSGRSATRSPRALFGP